MAGMETIPAAREKMVAGWTWIPVESLFWFFFSFLSPPGMLFIFVRRNCLFTGETKGLCTLSPKFSHAQRSCTLSPMRIN